MNINGLLKSPLTPIQEFFKTESSSGVVLLLSAVVALIIANTPLSETYYDILNLQLIVGVGAYAIDKPVILWINDGLMAIFFLLIGLEIKRELKYGELSSFKSALLPFVAAFGGALVPAILFFAFNGGTDFSQGWAISIATDIAFAIGLLALLGSNVPTWAKVFLTAVAVVDDLIAIVVIAIFYTASIKMIALVVAGVCVVILVAMNLMKVTKTTLFVLVGLVLWVAVLKSGVHATIAGVVLGLTIPARRLQSIDYVKQQAEKGMEYFRKATDDAQDESREAALHYMDEVVEKAESPLYRMEHALHPWVAYFIMPVFAFANAGVAINAEVVNAAFSSTLTWGIIVGLFVGKQIGIFGATYLMNVFGLNPFPKGGKTWKIVYGLACLSGVGFTMSLFIANLSFTDPEFIEFSKIGIIVGSLLSGTLGYIVLKKAINSD